MSALKISELLSSKEATPVTPKNMALTVLFYQNDECAELIAEAYRFEGYELPEMLDNRDQVIGDYVDDNNPEIVILELNNSKHVVRDAERISHMLPNHSSVIVIGQEDAISTIRNLKELGFYYLFWPVTKQEFIDFVVGVSDNRQRHRGPGQNRKAKYIGIYGSKGGVGTTLLATEIAYLLAEQKTAKCILVDHNYDGGNLDVMLARDDLEKSQLQAGSIAASLDSTAAKALLRDITERLSYLGINGDNRSHEEMRDLTDNMVELVAKDSNFVVEDLSASVNFKRDIEWMLQRYDSLIIVLEPTISSIREATTVINAIRKKRVELDHPFRMLTVLNQRSSPKFNSLTHQEIEKYLGSKVDVELPFVPQVNQMKLYQNHLYDSKNKAGKPLQKLVKMIMGERVKKQRSLRDRLTLKLRAKG